MTREEIINNLKYTIEKHKNDTVNTFGTNISVMCKDILDYLEQQPSEDCVSRAELLKQIKEWRDCEFVRMTNPYYYLEKRIQSLPPVTPTQNWVPISERLPRQEVEVLTCNEHGFIEIQSLEDGYWENQHGDCTDFDDNNVIAWQPLPKPYEEKRGGKNDV